MFRRIAIALVLGLSSPASAGWDEALTALNAGDYEIALHELQALHEEGYARADHIIAMMHHHGLGVPRDHAKASAWYLMAAERGYAQAQNNLGIMYEQGMGVTQDLVSAYIWYSLAAAGGEEAGRRNRDLVAGQMTADQIADAQRRARKWKMKQ